MHELKLKIDAIAEDVKAIRKHIDGGDKPADGLLLRVDRLEQNETRRRWFSHAAIVAGLASLADFVFNRHILK